MKLICAFQSSDQYQRLRATLPHSVIEWSENLASADELQYLLSSGRHDLIILDPTLWWSQEASELAKRHNVEIVLFFGDLRDVGNLIVRRIAPLLEAKDEPVGPLRPVDPDEEERRGPVRIIEKEKIVEVEKIIEKERIVERQVKVAVPVHSYVSMQSKVCLVMNLTPRAGATFVASTLASAITSRSLHCTLVEHPANRPTLYDHLNVADLSPEYKPPFHVLGHGALKKESELLYEGIAMYLNHPGMPNGEISQEEIRELIYELRHSPIILYDATFQPEFMTEDVLREFDHVFLVVDPDPVLLQRLLPPSEGRQATEEYYFLKELMMLQDEGHLDLHVVVNKDTSGVDHKLLNQCLPDKPLTHIGAQSVKNLYKAAWEARFLEIDDELDGQLMPILRLLIPENFLRANEEEKAGKGLLGRLFNKK